MDVFRKINVIRVNHENNIGDVCAITKLLTAPIRDALARDLLPLLGQRPASSRAATCCNDDTAYAHI